jgi:hypothetical protein
MNKITITLKGGFVDVPVLPKDIQITLKDYNVKDYSRLELKYRKVKKDKNGKYVERIFENTEKE